MGKIYTQRLLSFVFESVSLGGILQLENERGYSDEAKGIKDQDRKSKIIFDRSNDIRFTINFFK